MASLRPVVWISHRDGDSCAGCNAEITRGGFVLINRDQGIRCAGCAGIGDLIFLPAGDTALTRRALALSARTAIVVKFSRARKRHERQGVLVEDAALRLAEQECKADAARRAAARERRRLRDERAEQEYLARFVTRILEAVPRLPASGGHRHRQAGLREAQRAGRPLARCKDPRHRRDHAGRPSRPTRPHALRGVARGRTGTLRGAPARHRRHLRAVGAVARHDLGNVMSARVPLTSGRMLYLSLLPHVL